MILAPSFIDWTPYRQSFADQLSRALERPVSIEGKVTFALVPRPTLEVARVRIVDGADAVSIGVVKARLGLLPLLKGDLYFRELGLEDAVGTITMEPPWSPTAVAAASPPAAIPRRASLQVDRVEFDGGDISVHGEDGRALLRARDIDLVLTMDGRDRLHLKGDVGLNGQPISLDAQIGPSGTDGMRALSLSARIPAAEAAMTAGGRISPMQRSFSGNLTVKAEHGAALFSALGLTRVQTPALNRPLTLSAKAAAGVAGVAFDAVTLDVGGTEAKGAIDWQRERKPQLKISLDFAPFALEDWRSSAAPLPAAPQSASAPALPTVETDPGDGDLSAEIALRFPALSFRGQSLRDGAIAATLAHGELTISEASLTLPGSTRLNGFGLVAVSQPVPAVDGVVSLQTYDARGLLAWLGADVTNVPAGRLSAASLHAAVQGTVNLLELNDLEGSLDTARIAGRVSFAQRERPFIGVDLRFENVNVDSYRGTAVAMPAAPAAQAPARARADVYGVTPSGTRYAGLGNFDSEFHIEISGVTAGGVPGGRIGLDLGLKNGRLDIRTASFEKLAGTTGWFSGAIAGFGTALEFDKLQFDLAGDDIARIAGLIGVELPAAGASLGAASLTGSINGGAMQADVTATLKAAGLTARADGQVLDLEKDARFSGRIEAAHPRFSELMRAASYAWPANARDPGAFSFAARIAQEPDKTLVTELRASVGADRFAGSGDVSRVDGKTVVAAVLSDVVLDLDRVLPASAPPRTAMPTVSGPAARPPVWSQQPLDWSFLKGWRGEISLAGSALSARGVALQDFAARLVVADGAAELADWQGKVFGAPGQFSFRISSEPEPALQGQVAVTRADFRSLVGALNGGQSALKSAGTADVVIGFSTRGTSPALLVESLSGTGTLKVTAAEGGSGLSAGLLGPLSAAAQLDVATPGRPAPITFSTRLVAAQGIIKLEGAEVSSRSHTGRFDGTINLPRKQVALNGTLSPRTSGEAPLPISISGAMDRPNITLLPGPKK